ncbi:MAG: right-handed parallel beta-helix repeat-containing protein [Planctomycetota bacterium]|jgi:hypothetical protein
MTTDVTEDKVGVELAEMPARRSLRRWLLVSIAIVLLVVAGSIVGFRYWKSWRVPGGWEKKEWSWFAEWKPARILEADPKTLDSVLLAVKPGDLVLLADGDYQAPVPLDCQGMKGQPIVLRAKGKAAVFAPGIRVEGARWLVIEGITVDGSRVPAPTEHTWGVSMRRAEHCILRNCRLRAAPGPYAIRADNVYRVVFEDNEMCDMSSGHGLCVYGGCADIVIRGNYIHDNARSGLQFGGYAKPGGCVSAVLVEGNRIARNGREGGAAINCSHMVDSCFRNNLLYRNQAGGICFHFPPPEFMGEQPVEGNFIRRAIDRILNPPYVQCRGVKVMGNTVYFEPGQGRWSFKLRDECSGFTVYNNIFFGGVHGTVSVAATSFDGLHMDYNLITTHPGQLLFGETFKDDNEASFEYTPDQWRAKGLDEHSVLNADPGFVSTDDDDYRLAPGSPAIDAAKTERRRCPNDLAGTRRPQGRKYDCGAYESTGAKEGG